MTKPTIMEKYWYSIDWGMPRLPRFWELDLPIGEISMDLLTWHLDALFDQMIKRIIALRQDR